MSIEDRDTQILPLPPRPASLPRGLGMYIMDLSVKNTGTPAQAAKRAADAGLGFVAILGCWQEPVSKDVDAPIRSVAANLADFADYSKAFREAGIDVWIWGYPWGTPPMIELFVRTMRTAVDKAGALGELLDPELGFRAERAQHMPLLLERTVDSLNESLGLGFSSFGDIARIRDFPARASGGYGFGSPQLYSVPIDQARKSIAEWRRLGWDHIIASVPTFGPNSRHELAAYSGAILEHCEGLIFWQWHGTDDEEWEAIAALARAHRFEPPARTVIA